MRETRAGRSAFLCVLWLAAACGRGDELKGTTTAEQRRTEPQPIAARDCEGGDPVSIDVNNDGQADIVRRSKAGQQVCAQVDMNFDGRPDLLRFYEADGKNVALEQHDFDFDGRVDEQAFFEGGKVVRKELDTNFDGLIDTWMWCKGPLVDHAERARRKPGRVDTYEHYQEGLLAEIQYDENSDGNPEKWELFQQGSLTEVRLDTNGDGKPDHSDPAVAESADQRDQPVSCDGSPLPTPSVPSFPAGDGTFPAAAADAGLPTGMDAGASLAPVAAAADAGTPAADAGTPAADAAARATDAGAALPATTNPAKKPAAAASQGKAQ